MKETIGLIGIGLVGTALAERLLAGGFDVVGCDIDAARCRHLETLGGRAVDGPAAVGRECRRVMLSLMTTAIAREVLEGAGGLIEADPTPAIVIDTTTGDPDAVVELAARLAERGLAYMDATISGSSKLIAEGKGVFMAGGPESAFDACADVFAVLTDKAYHVGAAGDGAKAKLATNLVMGLNRLAMAEGLVFAERIGLDPARFLELARRNAAYSIVMDSKGPRMLARDYTPAGRLSQHRKDVAAILACADKLDQELPLERTHLQVLDAAILAGDGDLDNAAVIEEIRRRGPVE